MDGDDFSGKMAAEAKGLSPGLIVLLVVFLVANYVMYMYAQKNLPPKKKKPVSKRSSSKESLCLENDNPA